MKRTKFGSEDNDVISQLDSITARPGYSDDHNPENAFTRNYISSPKCKDHFATGERVDSINDTLTAYSSDRKFVVKTLFVMPARYVNDDSAYQLDPGSEPVQGAVWVGDNLDHRDNTKCKDIYGIRYYECDTVLTGHCVQFVGSHSIEGPQVWSLNVFDFFASKNYIQQATLISQPAFNSDYPGPGAFAKQMKRTNPRWPAGYVSMNTLDLPANCDAYDKLTADGYFVFKLEPPVNVEYV